MKQYFCFDFTISIIFLYSAGFCIAPAAMAASKGKGTSESGSFAPVYVTYPSENVATHSPTYAQVAAADSTPQKQGSHSKGKEKGKKKVMKKGQKKGKRKGKRKEKKRRKVNLQLPELTLALETRIGPHCHNQLMQRNRWLLRPFLLQRQALTKERHPSLVLRARSNPARPLAHNPRQQTPARAPRYPSSSRARGTAKQQKTPSKLPRHLSSNRARGAARHAMHGTACNLIRSQTHSPAHGAARLAGP